MSQMDQPTPQQAAALLRRMLPPADVDFSLLNEIETIPPVRFAQLMVAIESAGVKHGDVGAYSRRVFANSQT